MAKFKIGDNVRISKDIVVTDYQGVRGVVEGFDTVNDAYNVRLISGRKKGRISQIREERLELLSSTKSLRDSSKGVSWMKQSETWYETNYHGYTLAVYFHPSTDGQWEATTEGKLIGRFGSLADAQRACVSYADR